MNTIAFVTAAHHAADEEHALTAVRGEPLISHTVRGLLDVPEINSVVVVAPSRCADTFSSALTGLRCEVVPGLLREVFSSRLSAYPPDSILLVHDVLRAFTPAQTFRDVIGAVRDGAPVVIPVLPMADTVKVVDDARVIMGTEDRTHLRTAQTPLGFTLAAFRTACAEGEPDLDAAIRAGAATIPGHPDAMRVTSPFELSLAEAIATAAHTEFFGA